MNNIVDNNREFLLLMETKWNNPNGDPLEENRPRMDGDYALITDVRMKRTVRDYLKDYKGYKIFVDSEENETGKLKTRADIGAEAKVSTKDDLLNAFIDTRMFGAVYSVTGSNFDVTGPIQIAFSTSLNKVEIFSLQGTVKLPSSSNKGKGTMRWDYVIPYGIFAIYGAVNKNAARLAMLTEDDLVLFYEALYDGVNALHSRSKFGSRSLMLLEVVYKEQKDSLSFLNNLIQLESLVSDETRIRSIKDYRLNFSGVSNRLKLAKDNILRVEVRKIDGDLLPVDKLVIE